MSTVTTEVAKHRCRVYYLVLGSVVGKDIDVLDLGGSSCVTPVTKV